MKFYALHSRESGRCSLISHRSIIIKATQYLCELCMMMRITMKLHSQIARQNKKNFYFVERHSFHFSPSHYFLRCENEKFPPSSSSLSLHSLMSTRTRHVNYAKKNNWTLVLNEEKKISHTLQMSSSM